MVCPADVSIGGATGPSEPVAFPLPTSTGGAAPVAVSCTPGSGSAFNLGTTQVTCTATDVAARRAACSFTVTVTPPPLSITKFLAFGDSVTEGQNGTIAFGFDVVDTPNAYPTKLQRLFDVNYPGQGIVVVNAGVGGERIADAKARLPVELDKERPGALLLIHGYNDLTGDCGFDVGVTRACELAIEFVVDMLRETVKVARNPPHQLSYVFVGTLTPPGSGGGPSDRRIAGEAISRVNARIRQAMPREEAIVVDLHPLFLGHEPEYVAPDGLHPLPAGNQVLAEAFFQAIRASVPQTAIRSEFRRQ
jgi:lysophospholipase L1-like esterase